MLEQIAPEPPKSRYLAEATGFQFTIEPSIDHISVCVETVELAHDEKPRDLAAPGYEACFVSTGAHPIIIEIFFMFVELVWSLVALIIGI